jgi:hypothetical protein
MKSNNTFVAEYLKSLPEDRIDAVKNILRQVEIHLPEGFDYTIQGSLLSIVVPHSVYPSGYHCNPKDPLPFISIASLKNNISLYHMGVYADENIFKWFVSEYEKLQIGKLDIGKSCIRFKNLENIPFDLLGQLFKKMTPADWIALYEKTYKK